MFEFDGDKYLKASKHQKEWGQKLISEQLIVHNEFKSGGDHMQAYCVKCRAKREMKDARGITMKNGKPATQGTCPVCGTKMFRIGKACC